jgi:Raf kinase inhibitor-like YbhB/YbcL family protein
MRSRRFWCAVALATPFALGACQTTGRAAAPAEPGPIAATSDGDPATKGADPVTKMTITSNAFADGQEIPAKHTCQGDDASPALSWSGVPAAAKSLVLIIDDPDAPDPAAPKMTWVHWVLYNLPPTATGLAEAIAALPAGAKSGTNDWKRTGYGGPCPPVGRHRYFHKLYALDLVLPDLGAVAKPDLLRAMEGHVIAEATLVGTYQKR